MNYVDLNLLHKNGINYALTSEIDENIIITNTENYFKSSVYKSLCKHSRLSKIKIDDNIYIPELFIDSYASWYSSIYYMNKFKIDKSKEILKESKSSEKLELSTLKDILSNVIDIKMNLANIQTKNVKPKVQIIQNKTLDTIKELKDGIKNEIKQIGDDIFDTHD